MKDLYKDINEDAQVNADDEAEPTDDDSDIITKEMLERYGSVLVATDEESGEIDKTLLRNARSLTYIDPDDERLLTEFAETHPHSLALKMQSSDEAKKIPVNVCARIAITLIKSGKVDIRATVESALKIIMGESGESLAPVEIANAAIEMGELDVARKILDKLTRSTPTIPCLTLAKQLVRAGNMESGHTILVKFWGNVGRGFPDIKEAIHELASLMAEKGDADAQAKLAA